MIFFIYVHWTCQHKINHNPRASLSVTVDFFAYRPFSRFFPSGWSRSGTLGTVWAKPTCSTLNYWYTFSPCQLQVKLTGTPSGIHRIDWSYVEAKRISSLAPSSKSFWLAVCQAHWHIFVPTHVLARPVGHHNHHGNSQQQWHPYGALWRSTRWR